MSSSYIPKSPQGKRQETATGPLTGGVTSTTSVKPTPALTSLSPFTRSTRASPSPKTVSPRTAETEAATGVQHGRQGSSHLGNSFLDLISATNQAQHRANHSATSSVSQPSSTGNTPATSRFSSWKGFEKGFETPVPYLGGVTGVAESTNPDLSSIWKVNSLTTPSATSSKRPSLSTPATKETPVQASSSANQTRSNQSSLYVDSITLTNPTTRRLSPMAAPFPAPGTTIPMHTGNPNTAASSIDCKEPAHDFPGPTNSPTKSTDDEESVYDFPGPINNPTKPTDEETVYDFPGPINYQTESIDHEQPQATYAQVTNRAPGPHAPINYRPMNYRPMHYQTKSNEYEKPQATYPQTAYQAPGPHARHPAAASQPLYEGPYQSPFKKAWNKKQWRGPPAHGTNVQAITNQAGRFDQPGFSPQQPSTTFSPRQEVFTPHRQRFAAPQRHHQQPFHRQGFVYTQRPQQQSFVPHQKLWTLPPHRNMAMSNQSFTSTPPPTGTNPHATDAGYGGYGQGAMEPKPTVFRPMMHSPMRGPRYTDFGPQYDTIIGADNHPEGGPAPSLPRPGGGISTGTGLGLGMGMGMGMGTPTNTTNTSMEGPIAKPGGRNTTPTRTNPHPNPGMGHGMGMTGMGMTGMGMMGMGMGPDSSGEDDGEDLASDASAASDTSGGRPGGRPPPAHVQRIMAGFSPNYRGNIALARNRSAPIPDHENCSLFILGLPPNMTVHELLGQIRNCGRVYACHINRPEPTKGHLTCAAKVIFFERRAAEVFHARCFRRGGLHIRGWCSRVVWNRIRTAEQVGHPQRSRVLLIHGPAEFVNPRSLTEYFGTKMEFQVDAALLLDVEGGGEDGEGKKALVEYRFGSFRCQAEAAKMALAREYGDEVKAWFGEDPCAPPSREAAGGKGVVLGEAEEEEGEEEGEEEEEEEGAEMW